MPPRALPFPELDKLPERQLDETFALEVAGWQHKEGQSSWSWIVGGTTSVFRQGVPPFSGDDALVWPFLRKEDNVEVQSYRWGGVSVRIRRCNPWATVGKAHADTFARAAVIALIRAKRAKEARHT